MNAQAISPISVKVPPAKGFFMFRSAQQARSAILTLTLIAIVVIAIDVADLRIDPERLRPVLIGIVVGSVSGLLTVVVTCFEAEFHWTNLGPSARARAYDSMRDWLASLGYSEDRDLHMFNPIWPRWMVWDINFVSVTLIHDAIHVRGPWMLLKILRKRALRASAVNERPNGSTPVAP